MVKARSIKRRPEGDRWDAEMVQNLIGLPHSLGGADAAPGVTFEDRPADAGDGPLPVPRPENPAPRRLKILQRDLEECWKLTGRAPIRSRWVDINKGDDQRPNYRSRWVAQEIKMDKGQWELFAGTPPLEAMGY